MGLIRSIARRVRDRLTGAPSSAAPSASAAPSTPPRVPPPQKPAPVIEEDEAARFSNMERTAQEVKERVDAGEPVVLLDVREPYETAGGVIPGAILIPLGQLQSRWQEIKDQDELVIYCAAGMRSFQAAAFLRDQGIQNATSMEGGISEWMHLGGKVQPPK